MNVRQYLLIPLAIFVFSILILGFVYPLMLNGIGLIAKNNAEGSLIIINGTIIGSYLIAGKINNSAFFWANYNNSFVSGYDPYITVNQALSQVNRISNSTGISKQFLINIIYENSEQIEEQDLFIFSPGQRVVNVMELNAILIRKYPNIYDKYLKLNSK
ncbi:K+-transporting ATPase, c chain [Caldisphaera lagunensis DSM 15908]|uniref:K+-transporting ATPase, c chain n=1 Tax=Caldisphaera lagunensis (strain DSM 15908 / JCM 11604 / ANMR 0165 / IC-154) TaxID=1056495 RepID=L0AB32_CALLD|nr:potassium-transporting ATPase subunit C [Caldisphaera lagunensis]AFZ70614.1 K+-transporting ATPase, c chain [Caldisphaera lagunensis DSM 15908]